MTENVEPVNVGPFHDNAVYENNDDDPNAGEDVPQENSMLFAAQSFEDDVDHADVGYTNNEYVEPKDHNPDEFEDDVWVNSTYVKNITTEFNRYTYQLSPRI